MPGERVRVEVDGRALTLTHLDRVLYPSGCTKAEVVEYYSAVAGTLLTHLADRALTLVRYPNGVAEGGFFAKNAPSGTPGWVRRSVQVMSDGELDQVLADSPATLVWLANLSAVELHIPLWTVTAETEQDGRHLCDRLVIDLDPGRGAGIPECATLALAIRGALDDDGLTAYAKTTGKHGLHLLAPIAPCPVERVVGYVKHLAEALAGAAPDLATAKLGEAQRSGRVLLDWRQNAYRFTTVAPYSLRAGERPGVSTPVDWDEVAAAAAGMELVFTPDDVRERLDRLGDLAAGVLSVPLADRPELPDRT
ncbi:MAG TPA: non-homologous end-joining DNA ligase [Pseudonocardiaceae bacterium]